MSLRLFLATLQFMTRIPVPERWTQGLAMDHYERGIVGFPLIGLIVGGWVGGLYLAGSLVRRALSGAGLCAGLGADHRSFSS